KNAILERFGDEPLDAKAVADEVLSAAATLGERIVDTLALVEHALARDAAILLEGQLGAMRDRDWGIYPSVTSSTALAGGASLERVRPCYETLAGWLEPITGMHDRAGLPKEARAYLTRIEQTVGAPIGMVGVGPERTATLL